MKTKKKEDVYWCRLLELMIKCDTKAKMDDFLHLFLTMNEREYLVDRYRIVEALLTTDQTQREIAKNLNVSITKITDGSKAVHVISEKFRAFLVKEMSQRHTC
jgi:TrpR family trp operon transcriptional repressor